MSEKVLTLTFHDFLKLEKLLISFLFYKKYLLYVPVNHLQQRFKIMFPLDMAWDINLLYRTRPVYTCIVKKNELKI